jgi:hypothetical protein
MRCPACGGYFDMRDLAAVFDHEEHFHTRRQIDCSRPRPYETRSTISTLKANASGSGDRFNAGTEAVAAGVMGIRSICTGRQNASQMSDWPTSSACQKPD